MRSYRRPTIDDDLGELAGIRAQALGPGPGKSTPGPVAAPRVTGPAPSPIVQPPPKVNPGSSPPPRTVVTAPGVYDPTPAPGGRRDGAPDLGDIAAGRGTLRGLPDAEDDDIDGVIDARMAREEDLRKEKARALSAGAASAGLAGMGLSGASAARQSDIGRGQERSISTGLDEFDKQKAAEDFSAIQRLAAIADLEDAQNVDVDGDGLVNGEKVGGAIGTGNPDDAADAEADDDKKKESDRIAGLSQADFENETQESLEAAGWTTDGQQRTSKQKDKNGVYKTYYIWKGPNGEERQAIRDDMGETTSAGLEWA